MLKSIMLAAALLVVSAPTYANPCNPCAVSQSTTDISNRVLCVNGKERWKTRMFLQSDGSITVRTGDDNHNARNPAWRWNIIPAGQWSWVNGQVHTNTFQFQFHSTI